jgi:molybdopterin biosynthesis enzyme
VTQADREVTQVDDEAQVNEVARVDDGVARAGEAARVDDGVARVGEAAWGAGRHAAAAVPWDVARELAHAAASPLPPRRLALADAVGCVLATPLVSNAAVPPVDRSAMDGYAVRGVGPWFIVGAIRAGSALVTPLQDGQAYTIVTGAAVPPGTTAVLPDEHATRLGEQVSGSAERGRHIRRAGEECAAGELLLPAGTLVEPQTLGLAATLGLDRLSVIPKPRVLALVTGDELVHRGPSSPGRVRDAIGPMLPTLITRSGATLGTSPWDAHHTTSSPSDAYCTTSPSDAYGTTSPPDVHGATSSAGVHGSTSPSDVHGTTSPSDAYGSTSPADVHGSTSPSDVHGASSPATAARGAVVQLPDSREALVAALAAADADVILVSGSSASGPADHLRGALADLGAELLIDGVACRPGHPQALARLEDGRLVVGLPGNPLAALTAFLTLGVAAIRGFRGERLDVLAVAPVPGGLACHPRTTRLVPVRVGPQGAVPVGHGGSAMLRGAAAADAFAVVDPGPAEAIAARLLPLDPGLRPWAV